MRLVAMLLTMLTAVLSTVTGARAETFLLKGGGRIYGVAEKRGGDKWITVRTSYGRDGLHLDAAVSKIRSVVVMLACRLSAEPTPVGGLAGARAGVPVLRAGVEQGDAQRLQEPGDGKQVVTVHTPTSRAVSEA